MMRAGSLLLAGVLVLGGCAWSSHTLVAPEEYSLDSRLRHMDFCLFEAVKAVKSGAGPLDEPSRSSLKGRATQRFIDRGRPVLDQEGNPAPWRSPFRFYGDPALSDRYVVCLMGMGYRWDDWQQEGG